MLELAELAVPDVMSGQSLVPLLGSALAGKRSWPRRDSVLVGFERHAPDARAGNSTYPSRGLVTQDWLYIHNYKSDRWPQGDPEEYGDTFIGNLFTYKEKKIEPFFTQLLGKRPERELYRLQDPPGPANNKAGKGDFKAIEKDMDAKLEAALVKYRDPGVKDRDYFFRFSKEKREKLF